MNKQTTKAYSILRNNVIDFIIRNNGSVHIDAIANHTGMDNIVNGLTEAILRSLIKDKLVINRVGTIKGDVVKLTEVVGRDKQKPSKQWTEEDILMLSSMWVDDYPINDIADKLERTVYACNTRLTLLREANRLIPLIKKHKVIRDMLKKVRN